MSENLAPWFVTEPGGPMGQWPGVMEQGGRIIAFTVPDKKTAQELVDLRQQVIDANAEVVRLRYYVESLERFLDSYQIEVAGNQAIEALAKHKPPV